MLFVESFQLGFVVKNFTLLYVKFFNDMPVLFFPSSVSFVILSPRSINFDLNDFSSRYKLLHFKIAGIALKFSFHCLFFVFFLLEISFSLPFGQQVVLFVCVYFFFPHFYFFSIQYDRPSYGIIDSFLTIYH